jgi:hypothetical protein
VNRIHSGFHKSNSKDTGDLAGIFNTEIEYEIRLSPVLTLIPLAISGHWA